MNSFQNVAVPPGQSFRQTIALFIVGALVTALFSGSLGALAAHAGMAEVLWVGMVVPSFTWVVQISICYLLLAAEPRQLYWNDLGWVCCIGSVALLPAAL
ncbi:MAG TPA: hypothetical protein VGJ15_08620, partial [Pirellulales bacterium]